MPEIGQTILHYEILKMIGVGGMGEVYLADDLSLDRNVALKFLPDVFTADPERMARFEREAKLLASLNHPNIAAIYGLEKAEGIHFLVLELVEGETLQARLKKGALPVEEALGICRQIAEGLEAAHEKGVIHRDLKPANVMIGDGDKVKILDFGLAKALSDEAQSVDSSRSPTITEAMTQPGVILGTAAYMSPEQAKGKVVDKRADIWAFGCILYECLTGKKAFEGETVTETLASVLKGELNWSVLSDSTPEIIRFLLRRCLKRDATVRLRDIADARYQVEEGLTGAMAIAPPDQRARMREKSPWLFAALGFAGAVLILLIWNPWTSSPGTVSGSPSLHLNIDLPPQAPLASTGAMPLTVGRPTMALSPDGRRFAYVAWIGNHTQLYLRDMTTSEVKALSGTEDARTPFYSPDGQWIGFSSGNKLKKVSINGGEPIPLADVASLDNGAVWGKDDQIYFNTDESEGLYKVATSGGPVFPVALGKGYSYPEILPNGEILIGFYDWKGIGILNRKDLNAPPQILLTHCSYPRYLSTGHLLYTTPGKLMAVRFNPERMSIEGDPVVVLDDLRTEDETASQYAISANGTLVYASGEHSDISSFVWRDRHGNTANIGLPPRHYGSFSISHDGRKMAYVIYDMGKSDIYIYEFGGRETRLTIDGESLYPIWSPDDTSIIFRRKQDDVWDSYQQMIEGGQRATLLIHGETGASVASFTPDSKQMLIVSLPYLQLVPALKPVGAISDTAPHIEISQERAVSFLAIHPSGNYLCYTSKQFNRAEVFVRSFPSLDWKKQVSSDGGEESRWNPNGRELIYRWGSRWYAINVKLEPKPEFSNPRELFEGPYINVPGYSWDFSPDGERFLLLENPALNKPVTQLVVVTDFLEELNRLLPTK